MKKIKAYVASSWKNQYFDEVVDFLRVLGVSVYDFKNPQKKTGFSWSEIDQNWEVWTKDEYRNVLENNTICQNAFDSDFDAMKESDFCVLVLPCGRSAHTEAGWFAGSGKPVFVYIPDAEKVIVPELIYKIYSKLCFSVEELADQVEKLIE